ncbi:MAG: hypothetical protein K8R36_14345 [Planctomycetales bacterium]|nr:hypothetical protein [Planctomycetales bacterium]
MPRKNRSAIFQPVVAVVLLGIVFAGACGPTNTTTRPATSPPAAALDVSTLDFETPELKDRFLLFDRIAREAAAEKGWKHRDYKEGGNFVSAVWVLGDGYDDDCLPSREPQHQVGTRKMEVDTIVVAGKAKSAALTLEWVDASSKEWSLFCNYREASEQSVTGAGWGVTLFKWNAEQQKSHVPFRPYEQTTTKLELGPRYSYHVQNTAVEVASDLPQDKDFLRYLASPESLRDTYVEASGRLLKKIEETITTHKAEKRIFGKYNGDGRPPPSELRKLTTEEEVEELARAREYFARQDNLVKDEHVAMHTVLRKAFPFEKCWPELVTAAAK